MKYDYDALSVLAAVVRTGSFETAAKSLNVTQSAVSQRIKQLEERAGCVLIVRGKPCLPTEEGMLLCQLVEQVDLLEHETGQQLSQLGEATSANIVSVRISVNSDSLATWFPEAVRRAGEELSLRLEIIPDDQEFTEERLRSGDALAIVTSSEKPASGTQSVFLGYMDYLAIASPDFIAGSLGGEISLRTLSSAAAIVFDRKDTLPQQWMMTAFGKSDALTPHYIPSFEGHLLCARRGIGWAMMPRETVQPLMETGELVELVKDTHVPTGLNWQTRSQMSATLRRLSEIVIEVASGVLRPKSA